MHLLSVVERYLWRSGTPPTRFGREVMGDPRFVTDLRNGREPRSVTQSRVVAYLLERDPSLAPRCRD